MYENDRAAEMYDLLYEDKKDYRSEAGQVTRLIRAHRPDAAALLDVACGTGIHLQAFSELFADVEGVDLAEPMLATAARRLPGVPLHVGDMRSFRPERSFDAAVCMFSSIAYMRSAADLDRAVATLAAAVVPGGVVLVEPWWFPETFLDGYVAGHALTRDGRTITRVSHSTRQGDMVRMELHYVLADARGVEHRSEVDMLTLFTREQYEQAFSRAGVKAEYVESEGTGPGFFVGVRG